MWNNRQVTIWRDQSKIIHHINSGAPLQKTLNVLITSLERSFERNEVSGAIFLYDAERKVLNRIAAPSLPKSYAINFQKVPFEIKGDILVEQSFFEFPQTQETFLPWSALHDEAVTLGCQSSWMLPILSADHKLLGILVFHFRDRMNANEVLMEQIEVYKGFVILSIENMQNRWSIQEDTLIPHLDSSNPNRYDKDSKILSELQEALEEEQFEVYYQPYFGLENGVRGMEALIRWNHPKAGILPPAAFLGVAEESGLILEMEFWVLKRAFRDTLRLQRQTRGNLLLSVNISAWQLENPQFPKILADLMMETSFQPEFLTLEVTERFLIKGNAIEAIERIKRLGVRISIDDFGTAYSSLQYLKDLPINELKIDRSFIMDLETNSVNQKIVEMIIMLGHQLQLTVVAEGVETEWQLQILSDLKCDKVQGFLYSKPIPLSTFEKRYFPIHSASQG